MSVQFSSVQLYPVHMIDQAIVKQTSSKHRANIKQTSSKRRANIEQLEHRLCTCILNAFAECLLDDCLIV